MESKYDYVIIGGGLAAANALKELAKMNPVPSMAVICAEDVPPYDRPPLSKGFLLGKVPRASVFLLKEEFYVKNGIALFLDEPALSIDRHSRIVETTRRRLGYDKLLVCTGCSLRKLRIPGSDLPGLHYLRTLEEAESLQEEATHGKQAVVIGGGFIGLEVASVLAQLGLGVTVIHRGDRLMEKFASDEISTFYEERFATGGVHVIYGEEAAEISGDGRVSSVATATGRILPCDFAVAGIGVFAAAAFLDDSGLEMNNGVVVDEHLQTKDENIFAAGDVANFFDPVYGRHRRIEHWDNAIRQGKLAARNMAGAGESYCCTSYFYSTVFGMTFDFFGDMSEYDDMIVRGSFDNGSVAVFYLKEGVLKAAFLQGRPAGERKVVNRLISERRQLAADRERLADESFELEKTLAA